MTAPFLPPCGEPRTPTASSFSRRILLETLHWCPGWLASSYATMAPRLT